MIRQAIADTTKELRDERGMKNHELARACGLKPSSLSHTLNDPGNPSWGTLRRIAAALDLPLSELLARAERRESCREPAERR